MKTRPRFSASAIAQSTLLVGLLLWGCEPNKASKSEPAAPLAALDQGAVPEPNPRA